MTTLSPMLPPAARPLSAPPEPHPRRRRRWLAFVAAVVVLGFAILGAALVEVPYVAYQPGSVRPVTEHVVVEGTESYPPDESIAYTTVSIGRTTIFEAIAGWLDDDVDVVAEDVARNGRSQEENERYNAQLMDTSKAVATTVALRRLGYDVDISTTGAVVRSRAEGSPAEDVLEDDDVIVAVDGEPVDQPDEVGVLLQPGGPGASHTLTVERPAGTDQRLELDISTIPSGEDPGRAVIGILPEDRIVGFDFPVDIEIDSEGVGGPSAGLAFTLALLDVLTPGELTGGHRVAVTGTMELDGTVGPVGGGAQKAISVRDTGYDVFLVPSDELEVVQEAVGDDVQVIAVDTLDEALQALDSLGGDVGSLLARAGATAP